MNEEIDRIRKEFNFTNDKFIDEIHGSIRLDMSFVKDFKKLLNYIDKLQKDLENLKEVERQICCEELITKDKYQDILKENAELKKVVWEQKADMNKLINYIAIRENKTHEEVCKEFEV